MLPRRGSRGAIGAVAARDEVNVIGRGMQAGGDSHQQREQQFNKSCNKH